MLGGNVDVSGVNQQSVFVWALLLELEWEYANGWAPLLYALAVVMLQYSCASESGDLLGGDVWIFGCRGVVVEIEWFWVCSPGRMMAISEGGEEMLGCTCVLEFVDGMSEGACHWSPALGGVDQVWSHVWVEDEVMFWWMGRVQVREFLGLVLVVD